MSKLTISQTLKHLMFQRDIKTAQLAREVNLPQQTLQRIVTGVSPKPHQSSLEPLAQYFDVTVEQLKGEQPIQSLTELHHPNMSELSLVKVPLISWEDAMLWPNIPPDKLANAEMIYTDAPVGPDVFALRMYDSSMEPVFPISTLLIFDPHKEIKDRHYVLAKLVTEGSMTFRQLLIDVNSKYLRPLSPDFSQFQMVKLSPEDKICGILIQARRDYR